MLCEKGPKKRRLEKTLTLFETKKSKKMYNLSLPREGVNIKGESLLLFKETEKKNDDDESDRDRVGVFFFGCGHDDDDDLLWTRGKGCVHLVGFGKVERCLRGVRKRLRYTKKNRG